jgi:hypothetical protein
MKFESLIPHSILAGLVQDCRFPFLVQILDCDEWVHFPDCLGISEHFRFNYIDFKDAAKGLLVCPSSSSSAQIHRGLSQSHLLLL